MGWDFKSDSVQAYWNELENQLIAIIDDLAPLTEVINNELPNTVPVSIKKKMNQRKLLLKSNRSFATNEKQERIKMLNNEIETFFHEEKDQRLEETSAQGTLLHCGRQ